MKRESTEYKTRDLTEAACLLTLRHKLVRLDVDPDNSQRLWFVFEDPHGDCKDVSVKFWSRKLLVDPREFGLRLRELKDRIHSGR